MSEQMTRPSSGEIREEIKRLEYIVGCWNIGVTERVTAERSLRIARALRDSAGNGPLIEVLLADLRHLVNWHDQLGPTDIARAEATIARARAPEVFAQRVDTEIGQLRTALIDCCNAVGGMAGPEVSTGFLLMVPGEVRVVVAALRAKIQEGQHA